MFAQILGAASRNSQGCDLYVPTFVGLTGSIGAHNGVPRKERMAHAIDVVEKGLCDLVSRRTMIVSVKGSCHGSRC